MTAFVAASAASISTSNVLRKQSYAGCPSKCARSRSHAHPFASSSFAGAPMRICERRRSTSSFVGALPSANALGRDLGDDAVGRGDNREQSEKHFWAELDRLVAAGDRNGAVSLTKSFVRAQKEECKEETLLTADKEIEKLGGLAILSTGFGHLLQAVGNKSPSWTRICKLLPQDCGEWGFWAELFHLFAAILGFEPFRTLLRGLRKHSRDSKASESEASETEDDEE